MPIILTDADATAPPANRLVIPEWITRELERKAREDAEVCRRVLNTYGATVLDADGQPYYGPSTARVGDTVIVRLPQALK